ncbi:MAG: methylenetetrahydrofolate reductase C-terminal domain-containing protein [Actinomycetota bacterium]|nr:methylenetetrahydrofolate reductase C-terminal domain-containing protein [Actinomycetota bacterium]
MIITKPRDWERIKRNLTDIEAHSVFIMGCGQCASVAGTGDAKAILQAKTRLEQDGFEVTGWAIGEVACHLGGTKLEARKNKGSIDRADAVLVLTCGAGVQTVADSTDKPVFPGLDSMFLGNVIRHGVFEERCSMCGDCVLDQTAGICPVTTCPKGLLNGPCGGMWEGKCEVQTDRECTHVRIQRRLAEQHRGGVTFVPAKDYSKHLKPGSINMRGDKGARGKSRDSGTEGAGGHVGDGDE